MSTTQVSPSSPYPIVVGFDGSPLAERAFLEALRLAELAKDAEIHVVSVAPTVLDGIVMAGFGTEASDEAARKALSQHVSRLLVDYQADGRVLPVQRVAIYVLNEVSNPAAGHLIVELARSVEASMIVVGTHSRSGLERFLMGSVASYVVAHADCSVLVVRPADFIKGEKVPSIDAALQPGQSHLRHFEHYRTYQHVSAGGAVSQRMLPVS